MHQHMKYPYTAENEEEKAIPEEVKKTKKATNTQEPRPKGWTRPGLAVGF